MKDPYPQVEMEKEVQVGRALVCVGTCRTLLLGQHLHVPDASVCLRPKPSESRCFYQYDQKVQQDSLTHANTDSGLNHLARPLSSSRSCPHNYTRTPFSFAQAELLAEGRRPGCTCWGKNGGTSVHPLLSIGCCRVSKSPPYPRERKMKATDPLSSE